MTPWPAKHLTADDLDAFHSEALTKEMQLHLETCEDCRYLVAADRELVELLGRLPVLEPQAGFVDRVMTRVTIAEPVPVPVLSFPRLTRSRVGGLLAAAAGICLSVAWSATNRAALDGWLIAAQSTAVDSVTALAQATMANLAGQSWYESARQIVGSPLRTAVVVAASGVLYLTGIVALRRLITPSGPVSNARA
ncbi:MAG: hypothetical protein FJ206_14000 [Gemmatimonadetes bacterium]|nr:hypothetical protein [Gemmatimonadota bacterium]